MKTTLTNNKSGWMPLIISLSIVAIIIGLYRYYNYYEKVHKFGAFEQIEYWHKSPITLATQKDDSKLCSLTLKRCWDGLYVGHQDSVITIASNKIEVEGKEVGAVYLLNTVKGIILDCKHCQRFGAYDRDGVFYFPNFSFSKTTTYGSKEIYAGYIYELDMSRKALIMISVEDVHISVTVLFENGVDESLNKDYVKFNHLSLDIKKLAWFSCRERCTLVTYGIETGIYATTPTGCSNHDNLTIYWEDEKTPLIRQSIPLNGAACKDESGQVSPPRYTKQEFAELRKRIEAKG